MIIYVEVNDEGTVTGYGSSPFSEDNIEIEIDPDHSLFYEGNVEHFKVVDGSIIKKSQQEIDAILERIKPPTDKERIESLEVALLNLIMKGGDI